MTDKPEVIGLAGDTSGLTRIMTLYFPLPVRFMGLLGETMELFFEGAVMLNRDPNDVTMVDIWIKGEKHPGDYKIVEFDPWED